VGKSQLIILSLVGFLSLVSFLPDVFANGIEYLVREGIIRV